MSRTDKREIRSRLAIICARLLEWQFQPDARSNSWRGSIVEARNLIGNLLDESPSLRPYPSTVLDKAYVDGRRVAEVETGLKTLPAECPWTAAEVIAADFWPEAGQGNAA